MLYQFVHVKKDNTRLRNLIAHLKLLLTRSTMTTDEAVSAAAKVLSAVPRLGRSKRAKKTRYNPNQLRLFEVA